MSNLIVIAAPSGAGKTSLVKAVVENMADVCVSVSHTTRIMRSGEVEGQDYFYIDEPRFQSMVDGNVFLEYATVFGRHYGTSKEWVSQQLANNVDVILEIDWQGARQIKALSPAAILIFILPPSLKALKTRLENRKQDDAATIALRMEAAQTEMQHYREFDYLVVNDQFEKASQDLAHIILGARLKMAVQAEKQQALLDSLLN